MAIDERTDDEVRAENARLKSRVEALEEKIHVLSVAESELRRSEARFRALAERTSQIIWVTQLDSGVVSLSPSWCIYTGQKDEDLHEGGWLEAIHPDDRLPAWENWRLHTADKQPYTEHVRVRRHDGVYGDFLMHAAPVPDAHGVVHEWVGTYINITERKRAEAALRESEERFRKLAMHLPVGIFQSDVEGRCTFVNERWTAITGLTFERAVDFGWQAMVHPEDISRTVHAARSSQRTGEIVREYRVVRPDGEIVWVLTNAVSLHDESGEVTGYIGSVIDISLAKHTEELLRRTIEQKAIIEEHQAALAKVSAPLIPINDALMVMPLIGAIDEKRAALVMDTLLTGITRTRARAAILDITGVTTIDAQTADALVSAARAVRLLGAQIVLSGIRAEVAQTLVTLGAELQGIVTCGTLQSAIAYATRALGAGARGA